MAGDLLLDIQTAIEKRPFIKIDGTAYTMRHQDELGLRDRAAFGAAGKALQELRVNAHEGVELTLEAADCAERLVDDVLRRLFTAPVPEEALSNLSLEQRMSIVTAFFGAMNRPAAAGAASPASTPAAR